MVRAVLIVCLIYFGATTAAQAFDPLTIATLSATAFNAAITWEAATAIAFVANTALSAGLSFAAQSLLGKKGGMGTIPPNSPEVRYSTRQSAPSKRIVYGTAHVGGALFFERVEPPFLVQGFLVSLGPIESIDAIYIGTDRLSFPAGITPNTILTPSSMDGQPDYHNFVRCCVRLGGEDQTLDPLISDRFPSIASAFRQRKIATVTMEYRHPGDFETFQALYGNSRTPNAFFVARGVPIYDPRDPTQDIDDPSTWKFSNNAALVQANYLMAEYGGRINPDRMDWQKIKEAADYDDGPMGTSEGEFIKRHTIDGVVTLNQRPSDVMGSMLSANRGAIVQEGGKVWISSSKPKSPVLTITDDMICGGMQFQPFKNRRELINVVEPRFVAQERNYETIPGPEWRDDVLIAAHGEVHRTALNLPYTLDNRRCQRLAKLFGLSAQLEKSISVSLDLRVMARATGPLTDAVVNMDSRLFPQANDQYEVRTLGFSEGFSSIEIAAVQYDGSIEHNWNPAEDQQDFEETDIEA